MFKLGLVTCSENRVKERLIAKMLGMPYKRLAMSSRLKAVIKNAYALNLYNNITVVLLQIPYTIEELACFKKKHIEKVLKKLVQAGNVFNAGNFLFEKKTPEVTGLFSECEECFNNRSI